MWPACALARILSRDQPSRKLLIGSRMLARTEMKTRVSGKWSSTHIKQTCIPAQNMRVFFVNCFRM
jgi:hypothetical protein